MNVADDNNPSYVPVGLCEVLAGQQALAKLSAGQTTNMHLFAARSPDKNVPSIVEVSAGILGFRNNPTLVSHRRKDTTIMLDRS